MKRRSLLYILVSLILIISGISIILINATDKPAFEVNENAVLYSWNMAAISINERDELIAVITEHSIKEIYQDYSTSHLNRGDDEFIVAMNKIGVEVMHLAGEPKWAYENNALSIIKEIDKVVKFNNRNENKISGIVLDIEPYVKNDFGWDELNTFVNNLKIGYKYAKKNNLYYIIVIPYWYDGISEKLLEDLIASGCDEVSVMNYRTKYTLKDIQKEVKLAKKHDKAINTIYEINFGSDNYFSSYSDIHDDYIILAEHYEYNKLKKAFHYYAKMKSD